MQRRKGSHLLRHGLGRLGRRGDGGAHHGRLLELEVDRLGDEEDGLVTKLIPGNLMNK